MTNRSGWTFTYQAPHLQEASKERKEYHERRIKFWTSEKKKAEKEVRDHGIDFRDYPVTGGSRLEAVIDPGLAKRYTESERKLKKHKVLVEEYDRFERAFAGHSSEEYQLDIDDMTFFGL
jgi:hypothetical protein